MTFILKDMENKETKITEDIKDVSLMLNKPYIAYVFKKTQRIVQAVYLLTDFFDINEPLRLALRVNANVLLSLSVSMLKNDASSKELQANQLISSYLETLTFLDTAFSIHLISENNHGIISEEVNKMISFIEEKKEKKITLGKEFMETKSFEEYKNQAETYKGQINVLNNVKDSIKDISIPRSTSYVSYNIPSYETHSGNVSPNPVSQVSKPKETGRSEVYQQPRKFQNKNERTNKIISLFRPGVELMIKDISSTMQDVSEKTIQRELLTLVDQGILRKKGEKRWSRYVLA